MRLPARAGAASCVVPLVLAVAVALSFTLTISLPLSLAVASVVVARPLQHRRAEAVHGAARLFYSVFEAVLAGGRGRVRARRLGDHVRVSRRACVRACVRAWRGRASADGADDGRLKRPRVEWPRGASKDDGQGRRR